MANYITNRIPIHKLKRFILQFYIVGFLGFAIPYSFPYFIFLTPFALIISIFLLASYHQKYDTKSVLIFSFIFLAGLAVEIIGVNTGKIFGEYSYGGALGPKIMETPVIIGLNWLFLVYASNSVLNRFRMPDFIKVLLAAVMMVVYDLILEQVADKLEMWSWSNATIPVQNYLAWFGLAVLFGAVLKFSKINTDNKLSFTLLLCQFFFFLGLFIIKILHIL